MSEHPTTGVGAPEQPPTQMPPQQRPGEPPADPGSEAPTRAFAGFRTERRVPGPERRETAPPVGMPPWESTP
ncbi:MAG TPA: MinD/ParA family protein, partial [Mycobacterium sp.]|nr:MinD/ParA family protein [Mycobacterium sp.]